jgi:hypothetical protein
VSSQKKKLLKDVNKVMIIAERSKIRG